MKRLLRFKIVAASFYRIANISCKVFSSSMKITSAHKLLQAMLIATPERNKTKGEPDKEIKLGRTALI